MDKNSACLIQRRGDDGFVEFLNNRTLRDELKNPPVHQVMKCRRRAAYLSENKRLKIGPTRAGGEFCRKEIGRPQQRPPPPSASSASASAEGEATGEARGREGEDNVAMANFSPLERRAKRRKRRGHHDALKVSSHAGIDTLFQAPFTTRRARDDCAKSEEVRPRDASVIGRKRGGRAHATPAWNGGICSTGVGLGLRADGGVMMTADTVRSETVFRGQHKTHLVTNFQENSRLSSL